MEPGTPELLLHRRRWYVSVHATESEFIRVLVNNCVGQIIWRGMNATGAQPTQNVQTGNYVYGHQSGYQTQVPYSYNSGRSYRSYTEPSNFGQNTANYSQTTSDAAAQTPTAAPASFRSQLPDFISGKPERGWYEQLDPSESYINALNDDDVE